MIQDRLETGKLPVTILRRLLERYSTAHDRVILGPRIGEDVAALDMGDRALVITTDPITFATEEIGYYSVMVNANDMATSGAVPQWFTATILLPENTTTRKSAEDIFEQLHRACEELSVCLIGGHTEITPNLDRPVVVGQMLGEVDKDRLIATSGAQPGDTILLTKALCVEGTSIIAREKETDLRAHNVPGEVIEKARNFLFDPGISVVSEARLACDTVKVHSMHDITEGGLANGLHELAMAAGVKVVIDRDRIPVYRESEILCRALGLDPLGVIASGSLLVTLAPDEALHLTETARHRGLSFTVIGRVEKHAAPAVLFAGDGENEPVPYFQRDEIVKIF